MSLEEKKIKEEIKKEIKEEKFTKFKNIRIPDLSPLHTLMTEYPENEGKDPLQVALEVNLFTKKQFDLVKKIQKMGENKGEKEKKENKENKNKLTPEEIDEASFLYRKCNLPLIKNAFYIDEGFDTEKYLQLRWEDKKSLLDKLTNDDIVLFGYTMGAINDITFGKKMSRLLFFYPEKLEVFLLGLVHSKNYTLLEVNKIPLKKHLRKEDNKVGGPCLFSIACKEGDVKCVEYLWKLKKLSWWDSWSVRVSDDIGSFCPRPRWKPLYSEKRGFRKAQKKNHVEVMEFLYKKNSSLCDL